MQRIKEGTSAVLLQSDLDEKWRAGSSLEYYCYLRNVQDLSWQVGEHFVRDGRTTEGPIIPFGAEVQCHPISTNDQSRLHQFGKKVLPGICLGYALVARRIWKGDIMVADIERQKSTHVQEMPTSKRVKRSYSRSKMEQ